MTETSPFLKSRLKMAVLLLAAVLLAGMGVRWWRGTAVAVSDAFAGPFVRQRTDLRRLAV
jgi:hypothetical protein